MTTADVDAKPDVENSTMLDRIERVVRWSDELSLGLVKCNMPAQRVEMSRALLERLSDLRVLEITLDRPILSLLDEIRSQWNADAPPDAVCVYGLEKSINDQREYSPVLLRLNHDRELLRLAVPAALLIWLPDFTLDYIPIGCPDFWAWRSGVFEFPTNADLWELSRNAVLTNGPETIFSLPETEVREERIRLEELLRTTRSFPKQGKQEQDTAGHLLYRIASMCSLLGDTEGARVIYQQSLCLAQELGNAYAEVSILIAMGELEEKRNCLEKAYEFYDAGRHISRKIHNMTGLAFSLNHLGRLEKKSGNVEKALYYYEEGLRITEEAREPDLLYPIQFNLGVLYQEQGDWEEASSFLSQSLKGAKLGDNKQNIATILMQQGILLHQRGDLSSAVRLYKKSLSTYRKLENKMGIFECYSNIGKARSLTGRELDEAIDNINAIRMSNVRPCPIISTWDEYDLDQSDEDM